MDFQPHPDLTARIDVVGRDKAPVLVIDNFARDCDGLIDAAVQAFHANGRARNGFPGHVAAVPQTYADGALDFLLPLLRRTFMAKGPVTARGYDFQVMTTPPGDLAERQRIPHFDVANVNVVASVHYLCRPPHLGTAFFRHRRTQFELITQARQPDYLAALDTDIQAHPPEGYIVADTPVFETVASYEAVFNRMIFFSAASLHSGLADAAQALDADPRTGRLTTNMFVQFAY